MIHKPNPTSDNEDLARLRAAFGGHRIWRSQRSDGKPGDWVATLLDSAAGVDLTVIRSNPEALWLALEQERQKAGQQEYLL